VSENRGPKPVLKRCNLNEGLREQNNQEQTNSINSQAETKPSKPLLKREDTGVAILKTQRKEHKENWSDAKKTPTNINETRGAFISRGSRNKKLHEKDDTNQNSTKMTREEIEITQKVEKSNSQIIIKEEKKILLKKKIISIKNLNMKKFKKIKKIIEDGHLKKL